MKIKKFIEQFKKWRIGDYFRQFSIVTAGIVVTFVGGNIISANSTQKELKSSIQLIVKELESNVDEMKTIMYKFERDRTMALYLIDSNFKVDNFHIDTLKKYQALISQTSTFSYSDDALEVLKNSSLMQAIDDKNLLLSIIETYKMFDNTRESVATYYNLKQKVIVEIALESDYSVNNNVYDTYRNMLSYNTAKNFCGISAGFLNRGYFEKQIAEIYETIENLKEMY